MNRNTRCASPILAWYSICARRIPLVSAVMPLLLAACGGGGHARSAPDTTAPTVALTAPLPSANAVPIGSTLSVAFSEALDCGSVTNTSFTLAANTNEVDGTLSCNGALMTFAPAIPLAPSTTYTAIVRAGVKDAAGNSLAADYHWSFTAAPSEDAAADHQTPLVLLVNPRPGETAVALDAALAAAFDEAIDCTTLTPATFTVRDVANNSVSGNISCSGTLATFTPATPWVQITRYTATLTTGIRDLAGNALASDHTWSFTALPLSAPEVSHAIGTRTIHLSWPEVTGASYYRVLEKKNALAGYVHTGADITTTRADISVPVHLFDWKNASYKVEACTSGGCTASQGVSVESGAIGAVGRTTLSGSTRLGTQTAITRDGDRAFIAQDSVIEIYQRNADNQLEKTGSIDIGRQIIRLALSGDGLSLAVVGYNPATVSSDIYLYVSDGANWSREYALSTTSMDVAVALNGDGTRMVTGAFNSGAGIVHIRQRSGILWLSGSRFYYPGAAVSPHFGAEVAISDDGNSLVVLTRTSPMEAYAYHYDGTTWSTGTLLTDGGGAVAKLAMSADGNVLAFGGNSRVAVYERANALDTWAETQLTSSRADEVSFGERVAVSADGNVLAVGDHQEGGDGAGVGPVTTSGISGSGAVFVYRREDSAWTEANVLKSTIPEITGNFGDSLALSDDGTSLIVGAPGEMDGAGAFYFH